MRTRADILAAIAAERERQVEAEGFDTTHDDGPEDHGNGQLGQAAACYAAPYPVFTASVDEYVGRVKGYSFDDAWPWDRRWDKRRQHPRLRQLEIAAALCIAEIERLERKRSRR